MASVPQTLVVPLGVRDPEGAVTAACALAGDDGTVDAVVVIEVSPLLPLDARLDAEEASARLLLARARSVVEARGVRFVPFVLRVRDPESALLELAREEDAQIVVVGAKRRARRKLLRKAGDRALIVGA